MRSNDMQFKDFFSPPNAIYKYVYITLLLIQIVFEFLQQRINIKMKRANVTLSYFLVIFFVQIAIAGLLGYVYYVDSSVNSCSEPFKQFEAFR